MANGGRGGQGQSGSGGGSGSAGTGDSGGGGGYSSYRFSTGTSGGAGGDAGGGDVGGAGGRAGGSSVIDSGGDSVALFGGTGGGGFTGADGHGGGGGGGGAGGYGIITGFSGTFANDGNLYGGTGGQGGNGGRGADSSAAAGGSGGDAGTGGGGGGGIVLYATAATLHNTGDVYGGTGGLGGEGGYGGSGSTFFGPIGKSASGGYGGVGVSIVKDGGTLLNDGSAYIGGGRGGAGGEGAQTVVGAGDGGYGGAGVVLHAGTVTNKASISGGAGGAAGFVYAGTSKAGTGGAGVIDISGTLNNGGYITAGDGGLGARTGGTGAAADADQAGSGGDGGRGVFVTNGTINNTGTIKGASGGPGGTALHNGAGGFGGLGGQGGDGAYASGSTLVNSGTITGGGGGSGGAGDAGTGFGGAAGIGVEGSDMTIVNSGLIAGGDQAGSFTGGTGYAIDFTGGTNFIALGRAASFDGAINIDDENASLIFDQSKGTGLPADVTFSTQIIGSGSVIKAGAGTLTLTYVGNNYLGGTTIEGGTLEFARAGSGGPGADAISFQAAAGFTATLALASVAQPADGTTYRHTLDNFGDDDSLDLENLAYSGTATATSLQVSNGKLVVQEGGKTIYFNLSNSPAGTQYYAHRDAAGTGTLIDDSPVCFAAGTLIRTAWGDVPVEELMVGDPVVTASGAERPVAWTSHRTIENPGPEAWPVRVRAGAFGPDLPERDLFLSPGHPVLVGADANGAGSHLVPIMCLINGTTIGRVAVERITYWHVELDVHDILLAEGLPAESYIDLGSRAWFEGADGALYDPDMALPGMPGRCRPVAIDGPVVEAERRRLDAVFEMRLAGACAWPDEASLGLG